MSSSSAAEWQEELKRLQKVQADIRAQEADSDSEVQTSGNRVREWRRADRSSGRAYQPDAVAVEGRAGGGGKGSRSISSDREYSPRRDGEAQGSLGAGREKHGSVKPTRRESSGRDDGLERDDREASWAEDTLGPIWQAVEARVKRTLLYLGFDLSGDADALDEEDVVKYFPIVVSFVHRAGMGLDYGLTHLNRAKQDCDVWVFQESEAEIIARWYLKRARKVGWMAKVARQLDRVEAVGESKDVAWIFGKRLAASGLFLQSNGGVKPWINR